MYLSLIMELCFRYSEYLHADLQAVCLNKQNYRRGCICIPEYE